MTLRIVASALLVLALLSRFALSRSHQSPPPEKFAGEPPDLSPDAGDGRNRSLTFLPAKKIQTVVAAFLDGTILFVDNDTGEIYGSFSSGPPLSTSYQALTDDNSDDSYIYCGDDWKLYEYSKDFGKKKLGMTAEEYVKRTPVVTGNGGVILGSNRSTGFFFDAKSGKVISSYWTDGSQTAGGLSSNEDKSIVSKFHTGSYGSSGTQSEVFYIVRKDYAISRYTSLRKLSWSMTVSTIEAYSCLGFNCTLSTKLVVHPIHGANPFAMGLDYPKVLQLPEGSIENEMQHPPPPQGSLALDKHNNTQEALVSPPNGVVLVTPSGTAGAAIQSSPFAISNQSIASRLAGAAQVSLPWYFIVLLLGLLIVIYKSVKNLMSSNKQSVDSVKKQALMAKKRKGRKANSKNTPVVNKHTLNHSSLSNELQNDGLKDGKTNDRDSPSSVMGAAAAADGRWVGKLFVSNREIAKGSNGTVVFEGVYDGRPVAVKRLVKSHHDVASKEIQHLIASDQHPNIVRWFGVEHDSDFVYLSLERCICSLDDLIQLCSKPSTSIAMPDASTSDTNNLYKIRFSPADVGITGTELWREDGFPSTQLIKLMRDVVSGLTHLHELGIIHRDMKPQNVLICKHKTLSAKLSDMGISKCLPEEMSSLGQHPTGHGSIGWQAPEQLLRGRQTRAVDLFGLGCVLFFCMTKGRHPFGSYFERDANILNNRVDLFLVEDNHEAVHLFANLLNHDPEMRPKAAEVLKHPMFWDSQTRLSFLRDTSDRFELEDRESGSELLLDLQNIGPIAFGGKWNDKLDAAFISDMGRYRKYKFESTRDLLRVIRNKMSHYRELSTELKELIGPVPEGFNDYFARRFPRLLIEVYKVAWKHCREDESLQKYFQNSVV